MPTVPIAREQVQMGALPGVRQSAAGATPAAFGAGIGQALAGAGSQMTDVALQFQREENALKAKEQFLIADGKVSAFETDLFARPGQDAIAEGKRNIEGLGRGQSVWEKIRAESIKDLNERQRVLFDQHFAQRQLSSVNAVRAHMTKEHRAAQDSADVGIAASARDRYLRTGDDEALAQAMAALGSLWKRQSKSTEEQETDMLTWLGQTYAARVGLFLSADDPDGAEAYFTKMSDTIPKAEHAKIERLIKETRRDIKTRSRMDQQDAKREAYAQGRLLTMPTEFGGAGKERVTLAEYMAVPGMHVDMAVKLLENDMRRRAAEASARGGAIKSANAERRAAKAELRGDLAELRREAEALEEAVVATFDTVAAGVVPRLSPEKAADLETLRKLVLAYDPSQDVGGEQAQRIDTLASNFTARERQFIDRIYHNKTNPDPRFTPTFTKTFLSIAERLKDDFKKANDVPWSWGRVVDQEQEDAYLANELDRIMSLARAKKWTELDLEQHYREDPALRALQVQGDLNRYKAMRAGKSAAAWTEQDAGTGVEVPSWIVEELNR